MARAFIIRPFGKKKDSAGKELDFDRVEKELIDPALEAVQLSGRTTTEIVDAGNIREDMFALILEADLVICDVSIHNANVFYELGIRHALRKKRTILIRGITADGAPFDLSTDRYLNYDIDNPAANKVELIQTIQATLSSERDTDSPVFRLLPTLAEVDPASVQVVPLAFREEVERARAAQSKGWLQLLAQDVRGLRFERIGLELIATAQWKLEDYANARENWEAIRRIQPDHVAANLALITIYERLAQKSEKKLEFLSASDQAIERILATRNTTPADRVEALTLKGRNQKTRWRWEFQNLESVECRNVALSQALLGSYEAYRTAFSQDLRHYYSGLTALQMGTIFLELSAGEDNDSWKTLFDADEEAETYRLKLARDIETLRLLVLASVQAGLKQLSPADPGRIWAEISRADVLFLTEANEQRIIRRYKDAIANAISKGEPFAWDSAKKQLELFVQLGVKAKLAEKVIAAVNSTHQEQITTVEKEKPLPLHVVLFAGHRVDAPGCAEPRFPSRQESRARELIRNALTRLGQDYRLLGFAAAGPGAEILFHEICAELDIPGRICLPMPAKDYAPQVFAALDDWSARFHKLQQPKLELSDRAELPNWLHGGTNDLWERWSRWIVQMALAAGASQTTLFALWDGKDRNESDGVDRTAYLVQLARNAGNIDVTIIDTKQLLESGSATGTASLPPWPASGGERR